MYCREKSAPPLSYTTYSNVKFHEMLFSKALEKLVKHTENMYELVLVHNKVTEL